MTKETIVDNEHISMWYHPDKKIVHHKIHKFVCGEPLQEALEAGAELLKKNGACKWLSDDRGYGALPKEDEVWGDEYWGPKAIASGWRFWALVLPKSVLGKMSIEHFVDVYSGMGVTVKVFTDPDEGMAWLDRQ